MKKCFFIFLLLITTLIIHGCSVKPQPVNELYKLKLGMTLNEVEQILGSAPDKYKNEMMYKLFGSVEYPTPNEKDGLFLTFDKPDRKLMIIHISDGQLELNLFGIKIGSKSEDIIKVFGQPKNKEIGSNCLFWQYPQYNICFVLSFDKVVALRVEDFSKKNI